MNRKGKWLAAALVTALSVALTGCGDSDWPSGPLVASARPKVTAYADLTQVPESLAQDGTTIIVGRPSALVLVHLFEDPRCPVCKEFEVPGGGPVLRDWIVQGKARADYTMASFLDDRLGGGGSRRAVNALRAALEQGKFAEYHAVLYQHQPEESVDGFTTERLLELAKMVSGLRGPAFDAAVKKMKYQKFVDASQALYRRSGKGTAERRGPGTPTVEVSGVRITVENSGMLYDRNAFAAMLTRVYKVLDSSS